MEKMYEDYDPSQLNTSALEEDAEMMDQVMDREEEIEAILAEQEETQTAEQTQAMAEIEDPRNKEGWGLKAIGKELGSAIGGGLQDTGSSLVTLPERAIDMFSGEMVEESKTDEGYKAEWDDWFVNDENPIETKTWWGGAIRGLVHFGSMVPASVIALKAAGLGGLAAATGAGGTLVRGAAIGATSDLMSKYSQENNALGMVRDKFGWIDTPLSTKDEDHPAMKTLKNVVEGMGIGALFDAASIVLGKGIKKLKPGKNGKLIEVDGVDDAVQKAAKRNDSINKQNVEMAMDQVKGEDYGAYKNRGMANKWQGATTSIDDAYDVDQSLKRINNEYGAEIGSAGSVYTPAGLKRIQVNADMATKDLKRVMSQYMSDSRVQEAVATAKSKNLKLFQSEGWGSSIKLAQDIYDGRNLSELTPEEFWAPLDFNSKLLDMPIISYDQVKASELVIGSLLKEIRDSGITNRELYDIADLRDVDSPAAAMYDKVIAGIIHVKMSKQTQSAAFKALGNTDLTPAQMRQQVRQTVQAEAEQSIEAHKLAMQMAGDGDDDLFKAYMEAVSMGGDIHNLTDFDNYIMKKFRGGKFTDAKGKIKKESGLIIKGMGRVMTNSVLSGPKTPMRAILGTGTAAFLRPLSMALGASLRGDGATVRASLAAFNGMREAIPEAWTLFSKNLNGYWSGDLTTIKTRFNEVTKGDEQWRMYTDWIEKKTASGEVTFGEQLAFHTANGIRSLNDSKWLTYSTKIMGATDDAFGLLLARAKAKEKAMREAMDLYNTGQITEISPEMLKKSQDDFYSQIMDSEGNIIDDAALYSKKEATLTSDLHGFAKKLDATFSANPWTKPFLLFARTGMNGLELTAKHTPVFNLLVEETRDIIKATSKDLSLVRRYGITNATELANAKALVKGRMAIGSSLIMLANMHYISGGLTGNGPSDRQLRQKWVDDGWKPRSIKIGSVWASYDAFEPFNLILSAVGDIGDHMNQMGPENTEKQYRKLAVVLMQGLANKSYLASIQQFVDLFSGKEGQGERILASLTNNALPLSSLRNELGKIFNPHMKELNAGWIQSWRNRNLFMEGLAGEGAVPTKYDMLTGRPIKDWDFPTRMFNAVSPVNISLDYSPGRKLLFDSKYDLRTTTYGYTYGNINISFKDHPHIRSMFQKAIGDQNLQYELDLLAKDPKMIASIKSMEADTWNGNKARDPMKAYYHNDVIKALFDRAKKKAWSKIKNEPEVIQLTKESKDRMIDNLASNKETRNYKKQEKINLLLNRKNK